MPKVELGKLLPERFKGPKVAASYAEFEGMLQEAHARRIAAIPIMNNLPITAADRQDGVRRYRLSVDFESAGENKRKLRYIHNCYELRTSDPSARDTRSIMVPDWDIRASVVHRIEDAVARTFLSAHYMLKDLEANIPGTSSKIIDNSRVFSDQDLKDLLDHGGKRNLHPWPGTPGYNPD